VALQLDPANDGDRLMAIVRPVEAPSLAFDRSWPRPEIGLGL
jgi:hypothetical protein